MPDTLVKVDGVSKKFCRSLKRSLWYGLQDLGNELRGYRHGGNGELRPDEFWAVKDVSFELKRGDCLGLVGRNGAGKTTLLRMLNGLIKPDRGRIEMHGRVGALIALGAGFNPILTGRENIHVNASVLGLTRREIDKHIEEIIEFSEIGDFIDTPVQAYSSGMHVRLGFAVATALNPDVLILDEVLAVGDAKFRSKCIQRIGKLLKSCAIIFVSHDAWQVRRICDTAILLERGAVVYSGHPAETLDRYADSGATDGDPFVPFATHSEHIHDLTHEASAFHSLSPDNDETLQIDVTVAFHASESLCLGFRLGNITTADDVMAGQFDFSRFCSAIAKGPNTIRFRIADLRLSKGRYSVSLVIYDHSNKEMILMIRHLYSFRVTGSTRHGGLYAVTTTDVPVQMTGPALEERHHHGAPDSLRTAG